MSTPMPTTAAHAIPAGRQGGFTLVELLVTMAITTVILGATMTAMTHAINATDLAIQLTSMNNNLRTSMDVMVRDMLQVGQALPSGNVILVPSLAGSTAIKLPGPLLNPVKTFYLGAAGVDPDVLPRLTTTAPGAGTNPPMISAVLPGPGLGPVVNGTATDIIVTLSGDSSFDHIRLSCNTAKTVVCNTALAVNGTNMTVWNGPSNQHGANITNGGADDLRAGDLIMLTRGATSALVMVTTVVGQTVNFASGGVLDPLNLNQQGAGDGTVKELAASPDADVYTPPNPMPPAASPQPLPVIATEATRIRMVTYYIDAETDKNRPRLVRRINFGIPTAVAFDVEGLSISYDLVDGDKNPANVRMDADDLAGDGDCDDACSPNQIRKINIMLSARSKTKLKGSGQHLRNRLITQVSFRSLAFVDRYQ